MATRNYLLETHYVLGEGSRLVGEDVLDLAKLLSKVGCFSGHLLATFGVDHAPLVFHEDGLGKLDHFESHVQGYGHQLRLE